MRLRLDVFGSRYWTDKSKIDTVFDKIFALYDKDVVLAHGMNGYKEDGSAIAEHEDDSLAVRGADCLCGAAGALRGWEVQRFAALWTTEGKKAGPLRNQRVVDQFKPTLGIGFVKSLDDGSGSLDMAKRLVAAGVEVRIYS